MEFGLALVRDAFTEGTPFLAGAPSREIAMCNVDFYGRTFSDYGRIGG